MPTKPRTFALTIEMDDANMATMGDVARAMEKIARQMHAKFIEDPYSKDVPTMSAPVKDRCGKPVGTWEVK